nr:hypothetical protein [bacterium]
MNEQERMAIIAEEIKKAVRGKLKEVYPPRAWEYIENPVNLGPVVRANGFGILKGLCGDTMRIYLKIKSGTIS